MIINFVLIYVARKQDHAQVLRPLLVFIIEHKQVIRSQSHVKDVGKRANTGIMMTT